MVNDYHRKVRIRVVKITSTSLGRELIKRCGNEGNHLYLDDTSRKTLRFLRAAISFIPAACDDGADMSNAAFIFAQPGREFVIEAGDRDWEFYFSEDQYGSICGRCVRMRLRHYVWDKAKSAVRCFGYIFGRYSLTLLTMA